MITSSCQHSARWLGGAFPLRLILALTGSATLTLSLTTTVAAAAAAEMPVLRHWSVTPDAGRALVQVLPAQSSPHRVPKFITGKFAEHLGWNIYNGMDAQILRNPTFAAYVFATGQSSPDGLATYQWERNRIHDELRRQAQRFGAPDAAVVPLTESWDDGLAAFWLRTGSREEVEVSPDTGPAGGRAQRVRVKTAGRGIAQWTWLPLHRVREFEFEILARAAGPVRLDVSLAAGVEPGEAVHVNGLGPDWQTFRGRLRLPETAAADRAHRLTLTLAEPGECVVAHLFLRPIDHVNGADPDIIRLLRESRLPLLRWPGGNFVSAYHWQDGVGSVERRPTLPNPAWGGLELNTFGTDEFIGFCRAVGCEPMICVNAGDGTPAEAARWIEYCNGAASTPMGALRAANGHPEPYRVRHWEVGNELWGRWQAHWTTAAGYVDRFERFSSAMRAADPDITLYACGAPVFWGKDWNDTLLRGASPHLRFITDHPLVGGNVVRTTDPLDVFRDFMAVPEELERRWRALNDDMRRAGIVNPGLAVTELQVFAHLGERGDTNQPIRLNPDTLPGQGSITEALYDVLIYHACLRLAPFAELVTHSAVVNHGGGLRKERERVYANPCHYAQALFTQFADATPVAVNLEAAAESAPRVLPDLRQATPETKFATVDAFAAIASDGALLVSLVNRRADGPVQTTLDTGAFAGGPVGEWTSLAGRSPAAGNTLNEPTAVAPRTAPATVNAGRIQLELPPFSVGRLRLPKRS